MKKRQTIWKLFKLFLSGTISFKYFWNYDYSFRWILVTSEVMYPGVCETLIFNEHLKLIGEDMYKVIDCGSRFTNKEIKKPMHDIMYEYTTTNTQHDNWKFIPKLV